MTTPDPGRSYTKRGFEENPDSKRDGDKGGGDDEDWEGSDRRKHRSSKSRKHSNTEESEEWDSGGKRKNIAERTDSKKKSGDSSRAGSGDDEDYDARKELRSKLVKKSQDFDEQGTKGNSGEKRDRTEKKSSGGYQDNNLSESSRKSRGVVGNKAHGRLDDDRTRRQGEKSLADETERNALRKTSLKASSHENSQSKSRSKSENIREGELDKLQEKSAKRDPEILRNSEKKENSREKAQGTRVSRHDKEEHERNPHRKWDESDLAKKSSSIGDDGYLDKSDSRSGKASDKPGPSRDRILDPRSESRDVSPRSKTKAADLNNDKSRGRSETREVKSVRSSSREEKRVEGERSKNRGRSEVQEEDNKGSRLVATSREERLDGARDDKERRAREKFVGLVEDPESSSHRLSSKGHGEKSEKHRQQRDIDGESWERSINTDDDGHAERGRLRDRRDSNWEEFENGGRSGGSTRSGRDVRRIKRSRSPEGSGRHHRQDSEEYDRGFSDERAESDNERSISLKGKDKERDVYREIRAKGRESAWSGRSRDWDVNKDHWKKKHHGRHDKDTKDGDGDFDHDKDWDSQRHDRERMDREKLHGRSGYRKERSREGTKNSSSFGMANENSDMIEIHPKSVDYFGREESMSAYGGRRNDVGSHPDFTSGASDEDWGYLPEDRSRMPTIYGQGDDSQERYADDGSPMLDQNMGMNSGRENFDIINANMLSGRGRGQKVAMNINRIGAGQMANGSQPPFGNNQGSGSFGRVIPQGGKAGRLGRGGRGRVTARDGQRVGLPMPIMGPPFGHLGLPPGPMQPIGPNMSPAPGPPMNPGIFVPPFGGPMVWAGARGVDMNMLAVNPGLSPVPPPGPPAPRFGPNMGTAPNPALYYNQLGPGRGVPPSMSGPGFANAMGPLGRGMPPDKPPMGWNPPRISGPPGKAPSRGEQNDYSQNFVDTGMRPQNFIRELELTSTVEDYPKLRELIQKKDEIVAKSSSPPMYYKCDLREHVLSPEFFGTKFDVILVDPPWEEYAHRAPGVADNMECWTFEEIQNLKIEAIADTPSFIFLWVGDGLGLEQGRLCLKKWGFRRCEDICWVKTNKGNATPGLRHDSHTLFQHSKEHCLMGIKGTVRRSTDGHIIHANIDTDIIIAEEPAYGSTTKPEDLYRIIEHFSLGRRRIELFGEDHNIRSGWLTVGKGLTSSNFNAEAYCRNFADKDGKVWQGGGGRNPPPDAPHLVLTTPDIESLRPKSPPAKNQQQQSTSLSTTANSTVKRSSGNSPQNASAAPPMLPLNQEATSSNNVQGTMPWASPIGLKGLDTGNVSDDKFFDNYAFNPSCGQVSGEHPEFEAHRAVNLL